MVAERDRVGPGLEQLLRERGRYAAAGRAVLGVHDDRSDVALRADLLQLALEDAPPGAADDVAYHEYLHFLSLSHFAAASSPRAARARIAHRSDSSASFFTPCPNWYIADMLSIASGCPASAAER